MEHYGFSGDGGPATSAQLHFPKDLAFGPDGSPYIADSFNSRIRRVAPNGIITTVAGTQPGFAGDGGPAIQASLAVPSGVDVTPDGTIYIADSGNRRIRRVSPDGVVITVAGNGNSNVPGTINVLATSVGLNNADKVRAAADGSIYIVDGRSVNSLPSFVVRRVGTDGIIRAFAGGGSGPIGSGDGGPATSATLNVPLDCSVAADGSVYIIGEDQQLVGSTVRQVTPNGIIFTVASAQKPADVTAPRPFAGANGPATAAQFGPSWGMRVSGDGSFYIADTTDNLVLRVANWLPTSTFSGSQTVTASSDGKQFQVFDAAGRQLKTVDAFTNATLFAFGYHAGGRLATVTDVSGNVTQIVRDAGGNPMSIIAPFGEQTTLTLDSHGYLANVTDPAGQTTGFTYDSTGLMQTMTGARGGLHQFSFDALGRLSDDQDPAGGSKTLVPTDVAGGVSVAVTTGLGVKSSYQTTTSATGAMSRLNTLPNGLQSSLQFGTDATLAGSDPDGTTTTTTQAPDPRFGMLAPVQSTTTRTPSGLARVQSLAPRLVRALPPLCRASRPSGPCRVRPLCFSGFPGGEDTPPEMQGRIARSSGRKRVPRTSRAASLDSPTRKDKTMNETKKMKQLVAVVERQTGDDKKAFWTRIGVAFENRDGSWNLRFDFVPSRMGETTIQLRDIDLLTVRDARARAGILPGSSRRFPKKPSLPPPSSRT